jgi:undecaprenyl-diphosphatase
VGGATLGVIAGLSVFKIFEAWVKRDYKYLENPSLSLP